MKTISGWFCVFALVVTTSIPVRGQSFLTNGLICFYPLNGNAIDQLGNGNTGTLYNGAFFTNNVSDNTSAVYCNGTNGYVLFGKNDSVYPNQTFTWAVWFRAATTNNGIIFWDDDYASGGDRFIRIFNRTLQAGDNGKVGSTNVVSLSTWHQAVFTSSASGQFLYLDGALVGSTNTIIANHFNKSSVSIGAGNCNCGGPNFAYLDRFKGEISRLRIYNRALSTNEVSQLYAIDAPTIKVGMITLPTITIEGVSGTSYRIEYKNDLTATNWTTLITNLVTTNSFFLYPDTSATNQPKRFYRVLFN